MTDEPPPARHDALDGLPVWARAAVVLGVPSVIALFLVYALTAGLVRRVTTIETTQHLQGARLETVAAEASDRALEARAAHETLERLIRRVCVAAATTADTRAACLSP